MSHMIPVPFFSVIVKEVMEAKLCLVLMLFILGSLTVQGAIPGNKRNNPLAAISRRQVGVCVLLSIVLLLC